MKTLRPVALLLGIALSSFALSSFALASSALGSSALAQDAAKRLTNQDVIDMAALGLSDDLIIAKIRSLSGADAMKFDTTIDGLKALKAANVSDAVIKVMINPAPPPAPIVAATQPM